MKLIKSLTFCLLCMIVASPLIITQARVTDAHDVVNNFPYGSNIDAACNWWGTANATLVSQHNYDYYGNYTHGKVLFQTFLTEPVVLEAPIIEIQSPQNIIYKSNDISLTFTVDRPTSWMGYYLDVQPYATAIPGNVTLTGFSDGWHNITVFANDTNGDMSAPTSVEFGVDTTPPKVTNVTQSPSQRDLWFGDTVKVNATVKDAMSGVKQVTLNYTIDNGTWYPETMINFGNDTWTANIPPFPPGTNVSYGIVAYDNVGNNATLNNVGHYTASNYVPEVPSLLALIPLAAATVFAAAIFRRSSRMQTARAYHLRIRLRLTKQHDEHLK